MSDAKAAVAAIRAKTKYQPIVAIVLGSGLGALADDVQGADRIAYDTIPGWHRSTAPGHAGELVV
ncbi:MAG TPA: purine-nucleoside phosphorylase, partial [Candidatus Limnocylindria bacterium]